MERFRDDSREEMAPCGYGAVYTKDAFLRPLRNVDKVKRELILRLYYDPHHKRLEDAVSGMLEKYGKCLIIDCHSFSGMPLPYEPEQNADRPDFCIGTVEGHTDSNLIKAAVEVLQEAGHSVALDYPYSGSMIPIRFWGDSRVQTIMIEVNRALYQKPESFLPHPDCHNIKAKIDRLLLTLSAEFSKL
jgi:N-formylglutamate amidohydrolase